MELDNFKFITLNDDKAIVSLDTVIKFSGNSEKAVRELVRDNKAALVELGLSYNKEMSVLKVDLLNETEITYSELEFTQEASSYLLTLMRNTVEVKEFKFNLVKEFFQAREIITQQFLEIQENRNRLAKLELSAKDKVIKQLSNIVKDYKKITKNNIVYISANGLADDQTFTAKGFRTFMKDLKLVKQVPKLTYYWEATEEGLESQLVIVDANGTPYYNHEVCSDLYLEHLANGGE